MGPQRSPVLQRVVTNRVKAGFTSTFKTRLLFSEEIISGHCKHYGLTLTTNLGWILYFGK